MKRILGFVLNSFFRLFSIQDKIVFESGRGLVDGNPKAVYDYMLNCKQNKFKMIWIVEKNTDVSSLRKGDYVYYRTLKSYYHLATARYWIRSQSMGSLIKKRDNQVYIQLWHGSGTLKRMGYDILNEKERPPYEHVKEWDYYIANDKEDSNNIRTSTGYEKNVEVLGMACVDTTLKLAKDNEFKQDVLKKLNIETQNKKIVLYAPTFRDFDLDKSMIDIPISQLYKLKEYIFLIRLHPLVRDKVDENIFKHSNIINACNYPDASDLLAISDILITDYSSIFCQFSPLNRPIIFYPYDFEKYKKLRGGFYLNYEKDLPGPICYNETDLLNCLKELDNIYKKYRKKHETYNKKYNYLADGNASKRLVDKLIEGYFDNSKRCNK